ncbi:MAG TPA: GTP-binding protein [Candidatus Nanopusillus sp.]|nr:GTP-binding protein [Candidatus Nanopusillus sp.]HIP90432.1 GTP-binding protein [Candidatus Nanopusillus sp.]
MQRNKIVDNILNKAFRRAKENANSIQDETNKINLAKKRELVRIETVKNIVTSEIDKLLIKIPKEKDLQEFYRSLLDIMFEWKNIKKSITRIKYVKRFVLDFYKRYKNSIKITKDTARMSQLRKEFYGRVASFLRRNSNHFELLFNVYKAYESLPKFKAYPTVVIAGLPNVGKSTLLKKLTGSEPSIQPYPFTTKDIMVGYINTPYFKIQVIDTPGMLDRPFDTMNPIEKKAVLAIKYLAHLIIYVIDITETCGFTIKEQLDLLKNIEKEFDTEIWVYFSKTDLFEKDHWKVINKITKEINKKYFLSHEDLKSSIISYMKKRKELYL